jgi:predicted nucleic acid-binding protein
MKIVVDSNIVFSAILNTQSRIGQLLISGSKYFDFYSIGLLKEEILNHKKKIQKITGFNETQFDCAYQSIINHITFIDDIVIKDISVEKAFNLVKNIDVSDWPFVALNIELNSSLWSGDRKLMKGLRELHYGKIITTEDLYPKYLEREYKNHKK